MTSNLETAMNVISDKLREMHETVTALFADAIEAFEDLDRERAESTILASESIDTLHQEVEGLVFGAVSQESPEGENLRRLIAFLHTSISLKRVCRYARKVSEAVILCDGLDHFKELESIPYLAEIAQTALEISLRAVLDTDLTEIDELEKLEAQSDHELAEMFDEIADFLRQRRDISTLAMHYIIVGRYCERAADEAIAIGEASAYIVEGKHRKLGQLHKGGDEEGFI